MKTANIALCCYQVVLAAIGWTTWPCRRTRAVPNLKPGDGPTAFDQVQFWTDTALDSTSTARRRGDREGLRSECRTIDGRPMLTGVGSPSESSPGSEALDPGALRKIQRWREKSPDSIGAALVEVASGVRRPGPHAGLDVRRMWRREVGNFQAASWKKRTKPCALRSDGRQDRDLVLDEPGHSPLQGLVRPASDIDAAFREGVAKFPGYYRLYSTTFESAAAVERLKQEGVHGDREDNERGKDRRRRDSLRTHDVVPGEKCALRHGQQQQLFELEPRSGPS